MGKVSYSGEVAAILENKCQTCHRPGQVAPFSLLTYDDARKHSAMIREVVAERRMPPWHADPRYRPFRQRPQPLCAAIARPCWPGSIRARRWARPRPFRRRASFPEGWSIGKPDAVFEIPEPYYVPAQGVVSYVYFRVPTNFKEDRWVQAAEAVPGDRSVVHHIIVYVFDPERARRYAGAAHSFLRLCARRRPFGLPRGYRQANSGGGRPDVPGSLYADRPRQDRPLEGRLRFLQDQAHPRGVHPAASPMPT